MDFSDYSVRDFVLNESFQKWIIDPDEQTRAFWENWLAGHPEKAEVVTDARTMIRNIRSVIEKNIARDRDEVWQRIAKDIDGSKSEDHPEDDPGDREHAVNKSL